MYTTLNHTVEENALGTLPVPRGKFLVAEHMLNVNESSGIYLPNILKVIGIEQCVKNSEPRNLL